MRNNKRCIWTSSYDRGLDQLLEIWPNVIKEVPDAELYITYGWNLYDAAYPNNPERKAWKDQINEMMKQPGVKHLGRVGQGEMTKLLQECGIWAYPTYFDEISCISAMKAQIYGAIPVYINKAALKETVKYGRKVDGDIFDPEVKKEYTKQLISQMKDKLADKTRGQMMAWARKQYSWSGVAKNWVEEFNAPRVYSNEWAKQVWESLPEELRKDEWKAYRLK